VTDKVNERDEVERETLACRIYTAVHPGMSWDGCGTKSGWRRAADAARAALATPPAAVGACPSCGSDDRDTLIDPCGLNNPSERDKWHDAAVGAETQAVAWAVYVNGYPFSTHADEASALRGRDDYMAAFPTEECCVMSLIPLSSLAAARDAERERVAKWHDEQAERLYGCAEKARGGIVTLSYTRADREADARDFCTEAGTHERCATEIRGGAK
jgi:hypothetical protein